MCSVIYTFINFSWFAVLPYIIPLAKFKCGFVKPWSRRKLPKVIFEQMWLDVKISNEMKNYKRPFEIDKLATVKVFPNCSQGLVKMPHAPKSGMKKYIISTNCVRCGPRKIILSLYYLYRYTAASTNYARIIEETTSQF